MERADGFFVNVKMIRCRVNLGQDISVSQDLRLGLIPWGCRIEHQFFETIWRNRHALDSVGRFRAFNDRRLTEIPAPEGSDGGKGPGGL